MRGTSHNGRYGKNGVYSAKHNDRNFNADNADHINQEKSSGNWYWHYWTGECPDMTFEEVERRYYEENFTKALEAKNERYRKSGHKEDMKTIDEYRKGKNTCPEETIYQIGKLGDTVDPGMLKKIYMKHMAWEMETFPYATILNAALHVDEQGAPHIHERKVWEAFTEEGRVVSQTRSLEAMGIERPNPEKKKDRYNNPKMTYTKMCRDHFIGLCREYGIDLEVEPKEASKTGLSLTEYQRQQEQEKAEQARQEAEIAKQDREAAELARQIVEEEKKKLKQQNKDLQNKNEALMKENSEICDENEAIRAANNRLQAEKDALIAQNAQKQTELETANKNITEAQNALRKAKEELQQVQNKSTDLECITDQIDIANEQLKEILDMKVKAAEIHKIFRDKETQTYNKTMLDSIKAIGKDASEHMKTAQEAELKTVQKEKQLANREDKINQKEAEIEPLYEEAKQAKQEAEEYKSRIEEYIYAQTYKLIKEIAPEQDKLSDKMRSFMSKYDIGGEPMDKIFDRQQEQEKQKRQAELDEKAKNLIKNRYNSRDLEL